MENNKELIEGQKIYNSSIVLYVFMQITIYNTWECRGWGKMCHSHLPIFAERFHICEKTRYKQA